MAPLVRRTAFPKVLIERDADSEQSSSDDDGEEGEQENKNEEKIEEFNDKKKKGKSPIAISLKKVCKVSTLYFFVRFLLKELVSLNKAYICKL